MMDAIGYGATLLADRVDRYVAVARDVSGVLRERGEPQAAAALERAARSAARAGAYLRDADGREVWRDLQRAVEGRGWLLAGVGVAGGLGLARAIRSSSERGAR